MMPNTLKIFHIRLYPDFHPRIKIEKQRADSYFVRISAQDKTCEHFFDQLIQEYGSWSKNFLQSTREKDSFFDKNGTGTGKIAIASYVRLHQITSDERILCFDFDIKAIIEKEILAYNEQHRLEISTICL